MTMRGKMDDTLRHVVLVDADGDAGAARLLLDDFADALCAYARMGGAEPPTVTWADNGTCEDDALDCAVVAFRIREGTPASRTTDALDMVGAPNGMPCYLLCCTDDFDPADALPSVTAYARECEAAGFICRGGVIVGGGALVPRTAKSPRMGTLRRWRSEATDALIAAVRLQCGVDEAAAITRDTTRRREQGFILARCPIPRWAYRLFLR